MKYTKQLLCVLPILLLIIAILFYFIYLLSYVQPRIDFRAQITQISSSDYERIFNNEQVKSQDKGIDRFRHISIEIKLIIPFGLRSINNVKIERDLLHKYLEGNEIQVLCGGSFEHGNGKEYADNIEIYLKDISEDQLRTMLKDFRVKVTWQNIWHSYNDKVFYLRDYLK